MKEKIENILMNIRPDVDFSTEKHLITDGIMESIDIISLVTELEDEFNITIAPDVLVAKNFNSLEAIVKMVSELVD